MSRSFVTAADWDGDGVPDLLWRWSGRRSGIAVALGPFRDGKPFHLAHEVEFTPRPATDNESLSMMTIVDWDRDGKPDLLAAVWLDDGKGGIFWYRNLGEKGLKHLAPGVLLVGPGDLWGADARTRSMYGFAAGDLDGDGRPDLVVSRQDLVSAEPTGAWQGSVWWYRRE